MRPPSAPLRWRSLPLVGNPVNLLLLVFLATILEGAVRKWGFPGNSVARYAAYLSKDVLIAMAAYVAWRSGRRLPLAQVTYVHFGVFLVVLLGLASIHKSNLVGTILSLRSFVGVPLCAMLASYLVTSFRDVQRIAISVALVAIPVATLGIVQYSLPKTHYLNAYESVSQDAHIAAQHGHVRATGTFSYISGMAMMSGIASWAGMLLILSGGNKLLRLLGVVAVAAGLVCAATSMSRSSLMFWGVTVSGASVLYFSPRHWIWIAGISVALLLAGAIPSEFDDAGMVTDSYLAQGIMSRIHGPRGASDRFQFVIDNLVAGLANHPIGEGLGNGQPGGTYATLGVRQNIGYYESAWGRVSWEIGPLGLLGVLLIRYAAFAELYRSLRQLESRQARVVLAASIPFFGILCLGWMSFNHIGNSAAWGTMALALGAARGARHSARQPA